jgi:hypothetical protein
MKRDRAPGQLFSKSVMKALEQGFKTLQRKAGGGSGGIGNNRDLRTNPL